MKKDTIIGIFFSILLFVILSIIILYPQHLESEIIEKECSKLGMKPYQISCFPTCINNGSIYYLPKIHNGWCG